MWKEFLFMQKDSGNAQIVDVCIVGAGVVGLFLSTQLIQSKKKVAIVETSKIFGGQINLYLEKKIYNFPLIDCITGKNIVNELQKKNINENCSIFLHSIIANIIETDIGFAVEIQEKGGELKKIVCKYLVLATGKGSIKPNKLPFEDAKIIEGKQLFYSVRDKQKFCGKDVIIAGGGDSVIDWSCELVDIAKSVVVVHRRDIDRPENPEFLHFKELCNSGRIRLKVPYNITNLIIGNDGFNGIKVSSAKSLEEEIYCDYILAFYGLKTIQENFDAFKDFNIKFDENGIFVNYANNETSYKNIFAIGDCCQYNGKIKNIFMGFTDAMRCFYEICNREHGKIDIYGHKC